MVPPHHLPCRVIPLCRRYPSQNPRSLTRVSATVSRRCTPSRPPRCCTALPAPMTMPWILLLLQPPALCHLRAPHDHLANRYRCRGCGLRLCYTARTHTSPAPAGDPATTFAAVWRLFVTLRYKHNRNPQANRLDHGLQHRALHRPLMEATALAPPAPPFTTPMCRPRAPRQHLRFSACNDLVNHTRSYHDRSRHSFRSSPVYSRRTNTGPATDRAPHAPFSPRVCTSRNDVSTHRTPSESYFQVYFRYPSSIKSFSDSLLCQSRRHRRGARRHRVAPPRSDGTKIYPSQRHILDSKKVMMMMTTDVARSPTPTSPTAPAPAVAATPNVPTATVSDTDADTDVDSGTPNGSRAPCALTPPLSRLHQLLRQLSPRLRSTTLSSSNYSRSVQASTPREPLLNAPWRILKRPCGDGPASSPKNKHTSSALPHGCRTLTPAWRTTMPLPPALLLGLTAIHLHYSHSRHPCRHWRPTTPLLHSQRHHPLVFACCLEAFPVHTPH